MPFRIWRFLPPVSGVSFVSLIIHYWLLDTPPVIGTSGSYPQSWALLRGL